MRYDRPPVNLDDMNRLGLKYSDYIVYVDESGDHSLESINPRFPVFVLSFCVFRKDYYANVVTPAVRMLKFATFGHDMVIFHEQEIRKKTGHFQFLSKEPRERFMEDISRIIDNTDFVLIPIVIDKRVLKDSEQPFSNIYHLAMKLGLEHLYRTLQNLGQDDYFTHVVFEARGRKEDVELELEFRRVCDGDNSSRRQFPFKICVADKKTNSEGLQFADMVARPVGLSIIRPEQQNKAVKVLEKKFYRREVDGELVQEPCLYPYKAKGPKVVLEAQRR